MAKPVKQFRDRIGAWNIPSFLLNRYVFVLFVFAVWMTFFDQNNFIRQYHRMQALQDAEHKINYYTSETEKTRQQLDALLHDQKALERFAREKYYMKKPDEDIFVIMQDGKVVDE